MSATPRYAGLVAKALGKNESPAPPPPSDAERARAIATVVARMRAARRRRLARNTGIVFAAAACIALSVIGVGKWRKHRVETAHAAPSAQQVPVVATAHALAGTVNAVHEGHSQKLVEGKVLNAGDRLVVEPGGRGTLTLSTGTQILLEESGSLAIVEQGHTQLYSLETGSVRAFVAKLPQGDRFLFRTADAEIEVRGTAFRVFRADLDPNCGATTTRVEVTEGVVVVRAFGVEERVAAGEHWPKGCTWSTTAALPTPSAPPSTKTTTGVTATSDLATQNELFAQAIAAKRSGDNATALVSFDRFLAKYPTSPLCESAAAERLRILAATDRKRAVVAAREYLARYPSGPSRKDAEAIVAKGDGSASAPAPW